MLQFENGGKLDDLGIEIDTAVLKSTYKRFESGF
jgi:hypothetical protein